MRKHFSVILFCAAVAALLSVPLVMFGQAADVPEPPVVTWNKVNIARLRAMGVPGIPPFARDHVMVIVKTQQPEASLARVCVTFEGESNAPVIGCALAEFNETRQAAATVFDGFNHIDAAKVVKISVEEIRTETISASEVSAQ
jgi:hypothetical protein